jgi:tetratricopeptide (TPR) repeat protein
MSLRTRPVLSRAGLAVAVVVVAVAVAVGQFGASRRPGAGAPATEPKPQPTSAPADLSRFNSLPDPFVDKTPPPDDPGSPGVDLRAYQYSTDQAIRLFQARSRSNPSDVVSLTILGEFLTLKARESGDPASYEPAEEALRDAVMKAPGYTRARTSLAVALCGRHKFGDAFELARRVSESNPGNVTALAALGDAQLGLGRYAEAEATYRKLLSRSDEPATLARMAHLAELKGQIDEARDLLRRAAAAERKAGGAQEAAWYEVRLGELALGAGRLDEAERAFRGVLKELPEHRDATANLGKVVAARGDHAAAIALLEKSLTQAAEPSVLADLGLLYLKVGRNDLANQTFERLEQTAQRHPEFRRDLARYYAEQGRQTHRAVELARQDLAARPDVDGHDTLAWALYKDGRPEEAAQVMAQALKLGTQDATLFYHAGMIDRRLGETARARTWLGRALALNPHFSLRDADEARQALAALEK